MKTAFKELLPTVGVVQGWPCVQLKPGWMYNYVGKKQFIQ